MFVCGVVAAACACVCVSVHRITLALLCVSLHACGWEWSGDVYHQVRTKHITAMYSIAYYIHKCTNAFRTDYGGRHSAQVTHTRAYQHIGSEHASALSSSLALCMSLFFSLSLSCDQLYGVCWKFKWTNRCGRALVYRCA